MKRVRLLVCGGREFQNVPYMWHTLDQMDKYFVRDGGIGCVIDGAQQQNHADGYIIGADYWANQWAIARNKPIVRFHADWTRLGRAAGPIRNQRMIDEGKPDLVIGFEGGRGTTDMLRRAAKAGISVRTL
jgi:hypothetical protein